MKDYLGHRDPKHAVHYTRVAMSILPCGARNRCCIARVVGSCGDTSSRILNGCRTESGCGAVRDVVWRLGRRSGGSSGRLVIADQRAFLAALWSRAAHVIALGTVRVSGRDDERTTCIR